jgi:hypothetical protein
MGMRMILWYWKGCRIKTELRRRRVRIFWLTLGTFKGTCISVLFPYDESLLLEDGTPILVQYIRFLENGTTFTLPG